MRRKNLFWSILALVCVASVNGQSPQAIATLKVASSQLGRAYSSRDLKAVETSLSDDFLFQDPVGGHMSRQEYLSWLQQFFSQVSKLKLSEDSQLVSLTDDAARFKTTIVYDEQFIREGQTVSLVARDHSHRSWKMTPLGWKLSEVKLISVEYRGAGGVWQATPPHETQRSMEVMSGVGPTPKGPIESILKKTERAYASKDVKAATEDLTDDFQTTDSAGRPVTKSQVVSRLTSAFKTCRTITLVGNHRLDSWDAANAQTSSSDLLDVRFIRNGRLERSLIRSHQIGTWKLTRTGWKLRATRIVSEEWADAKMHWHPMVSQKSPFTPPGKF